MATNNATNTSNPISVAQGGTGAATLTGIVTGSGTSALTGTAVTQYNALIGGSSNGITSVAPSATSGVALISQGSSANPTFGTVVVGGGGTGQTSLTSHYLLIGNGSSAVTMLAPSATSGVPLISQGSSSDPAYGTGFTIDASGRTTNGSQPAFSAYLSSAQTNVTGDGTTYTVICDTEIFDIGSNYNNSTGIFTAPVTGTYLFTVQLHTGSIGGSHSNAFVIISTTGRTYYSGQNSPAACRSSASTWDYAFTVLAPMTASDTAKFQFVIYNSTKTVSASNGAVQTAFSGYLVC